MIKDKEGNTIERERNIIDRLKDHSFLYVLLFLFYGFIFIVFGKELECFFYDKNLLQDIGIRSIITGVLFYTFYSAIKYFKLNKFVFYMHIIISLGIFFTVITSFDYLFISLVTGYLLSLLIAIELIEYSKKINDSIKSKEEKIMILIGFFGIIISLINIIK